MVARLVNSEPPQRRKELIRRLVVRWLGEWSGEWDDVWLSLDDDTRLEWQVPRVSVQESSP